jgi:hypothetical protein
LVLQGVHFALFFVPMMHILFVISRRLPLFSSLLTVGSVRTRLPPLVIPSVSWVVFGSCSVDVVNLSLTCATLDFLRGGQLMIVDDGESCHAAYWNASWNASCSVGFVSFVLVLVSRLYSISSFKQVLSKMRFQSLSRISHYSHFSVTFVNVSLLSVT